MASCIFSYFLLSVTSHSPLEVLVVSEPPLVELVVGGDGLWLSGLELLPMTLEERELLEQLPPPGGPLGFSSVASRRLLQ